MVSRRVPPGKGRAGQVRLRRAAGQITPTGLTQGAETRRLTLHVPYDGQLVLNGREKLRLIKGDPGVGQQLVQPHAESVEAFPGGDAYDQEPRRGRKGCSAGESYDCLFGVGRRNQFAPAPFLDQLPKDHREGSSISRVRLELRRIPRSLPAESGRPRPVNPRRIAQSLL